MTYRYTYFFYRLADPRRHRKKEGGVVRMSTISMGVEKTAARARAGFALGRSLTGHCPTGRPRNGAAL